MAKDIKINVDTQTDGISLSSRRLGISSENLQGKIIFIPKPFIDGVCRMYIKGHGSVLMDKQEDCYTLDIKSSLLITPSIDVCFKITEPEKDNGVPIYATKIMHFEVLDTIESNEPIPEQYPQWKDVLDNYAEEKKGELDTYATEIQTDLKTYKKDLENEMSTTKDTLAGEITATATDETNKFNTNAESKTNAFNDNATEKTTDYNTNAETKLKEYNDNSTTKTEEYNTNATNKVEEFNNNVDSLENELTELAGQMPWNTTEIQDSIHVEDSAKYSRNKLGLFGNLEQEKREGYNLIEPKMATVTAKGITCTNNKDGSFTLNGTATSSADFRINQLTRTGTDNLKTYNGAHTLICNELIDGVKVMCMQETTYSTPMTVNSTTKSKSYTFNNMENIFIVVIVSEGITVNNLVIKPMLIAGTEIKPYEQYGAMPSIEYPSMPVVATGVQKIRKIGKNIFKPYSTGTVNVNGVTLSILENGKIHMKGTATETIWIEIYTKLQNGTTEKSTPKTRLNPEKKYTASICSNVDNKNITVACQTTKTTLVRMNAIDGTSQTFSKADGLYRCYVRIEANAVIENQEILFQIEEGDTATAYEPYTEETFELDLGTTELCKIVDENNNVVAQDRVVYKNGKWQFEKNTYRRTLNENDNWQVSGNKYTTFYVSSSGYPTPYNTGGNCNYFKWYKSIWQLDEVGYDMDSTNIRFNLSSKAKITTIDEWKNWLKEHNLEIYYTRRTTIYEDCTPAQSQVLDKLYKLSLQQGTNNIHVESENGVTTELQLTYMQDLMSQINELKQAMLNIGGN